MKRPDPFTRLSEAVALVLADSGPYTEYEIAYRLKRQGWGNPPVDAIKKVLAERLAGRVAVDDEGRWTLK